MPTYLRLFTDETREKKTIKFYWNFSLFFLPSFFKTKVSYFSERFLNAIVRLYRDENLIFFRLQKSEQNLIRSFVSRVVVVFIETFSFD